ncbi:unnamed protein product [Symbiodinium necroappetens]|uniref:Uncharacterized protein n=1 Tax=Symbiodinium necroappetens TaxID=1628268 RepID=A0A813A023_9DINO|nr:unnamed protein product [Symbiodinium necroappetens]
MPTTGDLAVPLLAAAPETSSWFLFRVRLRENGLAALSRTFLQYVTASLLHLRGSFSGIAKVLQDLFPHSTLDSQEVRRALEHAWLIHETLSLTYPTFFGRPCDIRVDRADAFLAEAESELVRLLGVQATAHSCQGCSNGVLTGDGGMKLTTALCNERTSSYHANSQLQLKVLAGCSRRPVNGSLFCKAHQVPACLAGIGPEVQAHRKQQGSVLFRLSGHEDYKPACEIPTARLRQYDSRGVLADYGELSTQWSSAEEETDLVDSVTLQLEPSDAASGCRCAKDERKRLAIRKYAGVFVLVLPCGHVVHVSRSAPRVCLKWPWLSPRVFDCCRPRASSFTTLPVGWHAFFEIRCVLGPPKCMPV